MEDRSGDAPSPDLSSSHSGTSHAQPPHSFCDTQVHHYPDVYDSCLRVKMSFPFLYHSDYDSIAHIIPIGLPSCSESPSLNTAVQDSPCLGTAIMDHNKRLKICFGSDFNFYVASQKPLLTMAVIPSASSSSLSYSTTITKASSSLRSRMTAGLISSSRGQSDAQSVHFGA